MGVRIGRSAYAPRTEGSRQKAGNRRNGRPHTTVQWSPQHRNGPSNVRIHWGWMFGGTSMESRTTRHTGGSSGNDRQHIGAGTVCGEKTVERNTADTTRTVADATQAMPAPHQRRGVPSPLLRRRIFGDLGRPGRLA